MPVQADNPPVQEVVVAEALTTFYDGRFTEFFVATADTASHELTTMEFYEKRPDLGEVQLLKKVGWDVVVPPDAQLFVPSSGLLRDHLNAFWVGWKTADTLNALSVYQEAPITVPLDPAAQMILPSIILPGKGMSSFFWLPKDTSWTLFRYEFSGNQGQRAAVSTERIGQTADEPLLSAAIPIPGAEDERWAVAWIASTGSGIKVNLTSFSEGQTATVETPAIPLITPLPRQRLAAHVSKSGLVSVGFIVESRSHGYLVMEVHFDVAKHLFTFTSSPLRIESGTLQSACLFYSKDQHERSSFVVALSTAGNLSVARTGSDSVRLLREHVDPRYDFPILTSATGRYEATGRGTEIELSILR